MGFMVYSFLWVRQDLYYQPYQEQGRPSGLEDHSLRKQGVQGVVLRPEVMTSKVVSTSTGVVSIAVSFTYLQSWLLSPMIL